MHLSLYNNSMCVISYAHLDVVVVVAAVCEYVGV